MRNVCCTNIYSAGCTNSSCPYQSPVKLEHIVSKPRNNSSVNITNMVQVLDCGVMFNTFNAKIG
jgi:hypothetical protein